MRVVDIQDGTIRTEQLRRTTAAIAKNYQRSELVEGDLLVSIRGHVGRTAIVPRLAHGANITQDTARVAIGSEADPRFIRWFIESPTARQWMARHTKGIAVTGINLGDLRHLPVPSPPRSEQQRIANIIDKADAIRRKRQEAIALTEQLLRSTFLEMFGDPVTNPKRWQRVPIVKFGEIITGNTPPREEPENYGSYIEWIKSDNINTPYHFLTRAKEMLSRRGAALGRTAPKGAVLISCIAGSLECIGNAAIADREIAFNQQINAIIPQDPAHTPFIYLQTVLSKPVLQAKSTGGMKGMLSKGRLSEVEFIMPTDAAIKRFGTYFERIHCYTIRLHSANELSNNLFNSLIQRAFAGQL